MARLAQRAGGRGGRTRAGARHPGGGPRRFVRTTDSGHRPPVAPNVRARGFGPAGPNASWRADVAGVPTGGGWPYRAAVEGLVSRVVGWSMAGAMDSRRVVDALGMAIRRRHPGAGLLAHAARGGRYASDHDRRVLSADGIVCRMSGVGPCRDNAPVGPFFGRLACAAAPGEASATRDQARATTFEYLEVFDNRARRHPSLGFVSPVEFERAHNQTHR